MKIGQTLLGIKRREGEVLDEDEDGHGDGADDFDACHGHETEVTGEREIVVRCEQFGELLAVAHERAKRENTVDGRCDTHGKRHSGVEDLEMDGVGDSGVAADAFVDIEPMSFIEPEQDKLEDGERHTESEITEDCSAFILTGGGDSVTSGDLGQAAGNDETSSYDTNASAKGISGSDIAPDRGRVNRIVSPYDVVDEVDEAGR